MSISKSDRKLIEEVKALGEENRALRVENEFLRRQVKDFEEKLNTNSRNSSKSPSQDPYRKRKGQKKPSGKKQGAQKGHQGHARQTVSPVDVTEFKDVHPSECPHCGKNKFLLDPIHIEKRQVTELPEIQPLVTQYNIYTNQCACCGHKVKAEVPRGAESAFGPRLKGFISLLSGDLGLTKRKVVSLVGYLNIKVSLGSVCNIHHLAGKILEKPYQEIKHHALNQDAIHADETSWYRKGVRQWLWVVTGVSAAFFKIDPNRSGETFQKILGKNLEKTPLTTDRYGAYNSYDGPKQYCWSHLNRDFEKIAERDGVDRLIGTRLKEEADVVFSSWRAFREGWITCKELQAHVKIFIIPTVKALILLGSFGKECHPKTQGTCKRLLTDFDNLWTYLYYEAVEPTNNLAERDIRPSVIQRKLSYGTQSDAGDAFVERLLSVAVTFKKQTKNIFNYLTDCFTAHSRDSPIPSPF